MVEKRISVRYSAEGGREVKAEAEGIRLVHSQTFAEIARQTKDAASSADVFVAALDREEDALRAIRSAVDPAYAAQMRYLDAVTSVERAVRSGVATERDAASTLALLEQRYLGVAQAAEQAATAAQRKIGAAVGLNAAPAGGASASASFFEEAEREAVAMERLRASLDPLFASSKRYEEVQRDVARAVEMNAIKQGEANRIMALAEQRYLGTAAAARTLGDTSTVAGSQVTNLGYQFNDVAVMLAAGQNPFMLAMQQGMQIGPVLREMQGGVGIVKGLGGAFMSIVSPVTLLTVGVIAGGAALFQYFTSAGEGAGEAESAVANFATAIADVDTYAKQATQPMAELRKEFGQFADEVQRAAETAMRASQQLAFEAIGPAVEEMKSGLREAAELNEALRAATANLDANEEFGATSEQLQTMRENVQGLEDEARAAAAALGLMPNEVDDLQAALALVGSGGTMQEIGQNALAAVDAFNALYSEGEKIPGPIAEVITKLTEVGTAAARSATAAQPLIITIDEAAKAADALGYATGGLPAALLAADAAALGFSNNMTSAANAAERAARAAAAIHLSDERGSQRDALASGARFRSEQMADMREGGATGALAIAQSMLGSREGRDRQAIQEYFARGGVNLDPVAQAWCAAFVNATLEQAGLEGTNSNLARSFLEWGQSVSVPQVGDVGVLPRGSNPNQGHVGIVAGVNPDGTVRLLGGNQGANGAVSYQNYAATDFLGFRRADPFDVEGQQEASRALAEAERERDAASRKAEQAAKDAAREAEQAGKSYDEYVASLTPAAAALAELGKAEATINAAREANQISQPEANKRLDEARAIYQQTTREMLATTDGTAAFQAALDAAGMSAADLGTAKAGILLGGVDSIASAFGDFAASGLTDFRSLKDGVLSTFRSMIAQMVTMAARNRILIPIQTAMQGGASTSNLPGAGLVGRLGGMVGGVAGSFGAGMSGFMANLTGANGAAGGLGSALGFTGSALAGATSGLAGLATAAGALALPVAGAIAAFRFFKGSTKELDAGVRVSLNGLDASISTFEKSQRTRFFGLSKKTSTDYDAASATVADPIRAGLLAMQKSAVDAGKVLGKSADDFAGFSRSFNVSTKGMNAEEASRAVQAKMAGVAEDLASLALKGVRDLKAAGESWVDTLTRVTSGVTVARDAMRKLGYDQLGTDERGIRQGVAFAANADGAAVDSYYKGFYSQDEQVRGARSDVLEGLEAAGLDRVMPRTRAEFRGLVDDLMEAGKAGKAAAVIGLAPAWEEFQRLKAEAKGAAGAIADMTAVLDQRRSLEERFWEVTGNSAKLAAREMENLGGDKVSEQWLLRIRAAEAANAAEEKAAEAAEARRAKAEAIANEGAGLQRRIWELTGDTVAIQKAELAALDPVNRAKQQRIWALEAEAEAIDKTRAAMEALNPERYRTLAAFQLARGRIANSLQAPTSLPPVTVGKGQASSSTGTVEADMAEMRDEMRQVMLQVASSTKAVANLARRWERVGMPKSRTKLAA